MKNEKLMYLTEKLLKLMENDSYKPMRFKDLAYVFQMNSSNQKTLLSNALNYLLSEDKISFIDGKYSLLLESVYEGTYEQGKGLFGFVNVEKLDENIFVLGSNSFNAFDGDRVLVEITKDKGDGRKAEGRILDIVHKVKRQVVGVFYKERTFGFVVCEGHKVFGDVYIPKAGIRNVKHQDRVVVEIVDIPKEKNKSFVGKIVKVIGGKDDENIEIESLIYEFDLQADFSCEALNEADSLTFENNDAFNRKELLDENIFTIDGASAKDLDDAVSIKKDDEDYVLSVHIADVSSYIKSGLNIDKEAYERGTSVYFPDRVIPMLPRRLCEDLCSLNPNEKKKAFSVDIRLDNKGKMLDYNFYKSIIKSKGKLVYDEVNELFNGNKNLDKKYYDLEDDLLLMRELSNILINRRYSEGNIDFDVNESYISVDNNGKVNDIKNRDRGEAERLIEQFMLAANTAAATMISSLNINGIYRVHEEPDKERLMDFVKFASALGYKIRLHDNHYSKEIQDFLETIDNDKNEQLFKTVLLRCMKKAVYTTDNKGHFALAIDNYTHFTSPIRRYPDLIVHRILSNVLLGNIDFSDMDKQREKLEKQAKYLSKMERKSEEAEREADKIFMCDYMRDYIGSEYEGFIDGFNSKGMFVKLQNGVEGLVYFNTLKDDYYDYDSERYCAIGRKFHRKYTIGDNVKIKVISSSKLKREIEFSII